MITPFTTTLSSAIPMTRSSSPPSTSSSPSSSFSSSDRIRTVIGKSSVSKRASPITPSVITNTASASIRKAAETFKSRTSMQQPLPYLSTSSDTTAMQSMMSMQPPYPIPAALHPSLRPNSSNRSMSAPIVAPPPYSAMDPAARRAFIPPAFSVPQISTSSEIESKAGPAPVLPPHQGSFSASPAPVSPVLEDHRKQRFIDQLADVTVKVLTRLLAVRFAKEAAAQNLAREGNVMQDVQQHPTELSHPPLAAPPTMHPRLFKTVSDPLRKASVASGASHDSHLETPPYSPSQVSSPMTHSTPPLNTSIFPSPDQLLEDVHHHVRSSPLTTPSPITASYIHWHSQILRLRDMARAFASNPYLSRAPHGILYALYLARRILLCPDETIHSISSPVSSTPSLHPIPRALLMDPCHLFLSCLLLAETHVSDRQTSTRVWAKAAAPWVSSNTLDANVSPSRYCARIKAMGLDALHFNTHVTVEEYASWVKALRTIMDEAEVVVPVAVPQRRSANALASPVFASNENGAQWSHHSAPPLCPPVVDSVRGDVRMPPSYAPAPFHAAHDNQARIAMHLHAARGWVMGGRHM
ncbi:hypothetical protein BC829DRAFT_397361 [Chytridium lagenaria]|nr:hypothetical protein BC829DRAFT_397361 [Chytridium lagenaria]